MKKILTIAFAVLAVAACKKETDSNPIIDPDPIDPVITVLDANQQRERLREAGEKLLDAVDVNAIEKEIGKVMELEDLDYDKYSEGAAIEAVQNAINNMYSMVGNEYVTIYDLSALKGKYSFINGVQKVSSSDNISINFENKWTAEVEFSSKTVKVLVDKYRESKEYVKIPSYVSIVVCRNNQQIVSASINIDTDITDVTETPDMAGVHCYISSTLEFAGYKISVAKVGYGNKSAVANISLAKGDKVLISEKLSVDKIAFEQKYAEPIGAGTGHFEIDVLGLVQAKADVKDISAIIDYADKADNTNETKFKHYISEINELIDNGIYFSSEVKQSHFELYPFERTYYSRTKWYCTPVFVLSDGTKYEDISDFFSERYFSSVIYGFEDLADFFEDIF